MGGEVGKASMGPRLCSRGDTADRSASSAKSPALQWGRGFVAAETRSVLRQIAPVALLQWGRGFVAAETVVDSGLFKSESMLQWGRGFVAAETGPLHRLVLRYPPASMGPRLCSRGDHAGKHTRRDDTMTLQWGRGFVAAETSRKCAGQELGIVLQWGRGFVAAETARART